MNDGDLRIHARLALTIGLLSSAVLGFILSGCGGAVPQLTGSVAGIVYDSLGNPVRGARVFIAGGGETISSSSGSFVLESVVVNDQLIEATTRTGTVDFYGSNVARVFGNERSRNVNIRLINTNQLAEMIGTTADASGNLLEGVRVFAKPNDGSIFTSSAAISGTNGTFRITGLQAGVTYEIQASGLEYGSDLRSMILTAGESRTVNFRLGNASNPLLPAPANVVSSAWTAPPQPTTRSAGQGDPLAAIRAIVEPNRRNRKTLISEKRSALRSSGSRSNRDDISIEVYWDRISVRDLIGFLVARSINNSPFEDYDYARDPYAELFVDSDVNLVAGNDYTYSIQSLSTVWDGNGRGESDFSDLTTIRPLGRLTVTGVSGVGPTVGWNSVVGATKYSIFLFDRYPGAGVDPIYDNFQSPVSGTSLTIPNIGLIPGRTYYFMVLGSTPDTFTRTISSVMTFVAP